MGFRRRSSFSAVLAACEVAFTPNHMLKETRNGPDKRIVFRSTSKVELPPIDIAPPLISPKRYTILSSARSAPVSVMARAAGSRVAHVGATDVSISVAENGTLEAMLPSS